MCEHVSDCECVSECECESVLLSVRLNECKCECV